MRPSAGTQHLRPRGGIGAMTHAEILNILLSLVIMIMLFRLIRRLDSRMDKLQDRVHNDYEALIVKVVELEKKVEELEAHVKRLDEKLLLEVEFRRR
jgi:hypothetical protein